MTVTFQTMTDDQRKSVALEFLKRLERGKSFFDLFADDAQVYFPKWGMVTGREEFEKLFGDLSAALTSISHDYAYFNYAIQGDLVVIEGTSRGRLPTEAEWQPEVTETGRWCKVFEIRDFKIQRCFIYLDPDEVFVATDISGAMEAPVIG